MVGLLRLTVGPHVVAAGTAQPPRRSTRGHHTKGSSVLSAGITLILGFGGMSWIWFRRPEQRMQVMIVVAAAGLLFQIIHVLEHAAQTAAWMAHPNQPPWLTPWAATGRDWLAHGGDIALGNELLHLVGNLVFLAGLAALAGIVARFGAHRPRALTAALWIQGLHLAEHAALTASTAIAGTAVGVTTALGQLPPGPGLWTLRVIAHFTINAAATVAMLCALHDVWSVDDEVIAADGNSGP